MLGYGVVAPRYPIEFPRVLSDSGQWTTASVGKDHFGWNATDNQGINHGYQTTTLYDGLGGWDETMPHNHTGEFDDYDQWFAAVMPGKDPQATLDGFDGNGWNGWNGKAYVYDEYYHPTAWVGRRAVTFLRAHAAAVEAAAVEPSPPSPSPPSPPKPFLLKVSFHRPHSPYDPPARILNQIPASSLPSPHLCAKAGSGGPGGGEPAPADDTGHSSGWCLRFRGNKTLQDTIGCGPSNPDAWCGEMNEPNATIGRRAYAGSVRFVDEQIGMIYDVLSSTSLLDNTWIIFTADHGDGQGDHYHWRKGFPYEFSARVPMIVRWPKSFEEKEKTKEGYGGKSVIVPRGTVIRPPIVTELRDVFHTIIDIANLTSLIKTSHFQPEDGKSMLCLLRQRSSSNEDGSFSNNNCTYSLNPGPWRQSLDMEHDICYNASNHWSAVTNGQYKYIYRANFDDEQLFDLSVDPTETIDVSNEKKYQTVLIKYRNNMIQQFLREERGDEWVKNGALVKRTKGTTYSPHYPPTQINVPRVQQKR